MWLLLNIGCVSGEFRGSETFKFKENVLLSAKAWTKQEISVLVWCLSREFSTSVLPQTSIRNLHWTAQDSRSEWIFSCLAPSTPTCPRWVRTQPVSVLPALLTLFVSLLFCLVSVSVWEKLLFLPQNKTYALKCPDHFVLIEPYFRQSLTRTSMMTLFLFCCIILSHMKWLRYKLLFHRTRDHLHHRIWRNIWDFFPLKAFSETGYVTLMALTVLI